MSTFVYQKTLKIINMKAMTVSELFKARKLLFTILDSVLHSSDFSASDYDRTLSAYDTFMEISYRLLEKK